MDGTVVKNTILTMAATALALSIGTACQAETLEVTTLKTELKTDALKAETIKTELVRGTRVSLAKTDNFTAAPNFSGYIDKATHASIIVT